MLRGKVIDCLEIKDEPVTPCKCALAITIPTECGNFLADFDRKNKDFVHSYKKEREEEGASNQYYWNLYESTAKLVEKICKDLDRMGVEVKINATLSDFRDLLEKYRVVSLVTHSSFRSLDLREVICPKRLLKRLLSPKDRLEEIISSIFREKSKQLLNSSFLDSQFTDVELSEKLLYVVNSIIDEAHSLYNKNSKNKIESNGNNSREQILIRPTRVTFEELYAEEITPGYCIEFSDRLYTVREVINSVPLKFNGIIDLTICNSVLISEVIKKYRPDCLIAVNRYKAELVARLLIYKETIKDLRKGKPFIDSLTKIHNQSEK